MKSVAFAALAALMLTTPLAARDLAGERRNALNHVAQVMAVEVDCPGYEASPGPMALLMAGYKLDISGEHRAQFAKLVAEHRAGLAAAGSAGCLVGWALYGPGGQSVPNLMRKR